MRKIRIVVELPLPDGGDPTEAAEEFARDGSEDAELLTVVVGDLSEDARIAAAGDSIVAALAQHFPGVYEEPEANTDAAILLADVLGGVLALQLAVETEVEAAETVDIVIERVQSSARSGAEKLRSVYKKDMN